MQIIRLVDFCFSFSLDCMLPFNAVQLRLMRTKQHGCLQMLLKFQQQRSHRQCLEYPLRWVCTFRWNYILFFKYVILYYYDYSSCYFFLWIFNMCNLFFLHNWKNFIQEINHSGAGDCGQSLSIIEVSLNFVWSITWILIYFSWIFKKIWDDT